MLRRAIRFSILALAVGLAVASAQGSFGHIAYGDGWQTTFILVNLFGRWCDAFADGDGLRLSGTVRRHDRAGRIGNRGPSQ
jgi:hypothetical protein